MEHLSEPNDDETSGNCLKTIIASRIGQKDGKITAFFGGELDKAVVSKTDLGRHTFLRFVCQVEDCNAGCLVTNMYDHIGVRPLIATGCTASLEDCIQP